MTEPTWKFWTPERDGHAPDDWVEGHPYQWRGRDGANWISGLASPDWFASLQYRYRPLPTVEPSFDTLKAQCLQLPEEERSALVEALQKPQRDWADDVTLEVLEASSVLYEKYLLDHNKISAVIRSMCRPREVEVDAEIVRKIANQWGIHPITVEHIISEALS